MNHNSTTRIDPFTHFPTEVCLNIISQIQDATDIANVAQTSKSWLKLLRDDYTWRLICKNHHYIHDSPISISKASFLDFRIQLQSHSRLLQNPLENNNETQLYKSYFIYQYLLRRSLKSGGKIIKQNIFEKGNKSSVFITENFIVTKIIAWSKQTGAITYKLGVYDFNGNFLYFLNDTKLEHVDIIYHNKQYGGDTIFTTCSTPGDYNIHIWNLKTGRLVKTLSGHYRSVQSIKMASANVVVSTSLDQSLVIWNFKDAEIIKRVRIETPDSKYFDAQGDIVITGSREGKCLIRKANTGEIINVVRGVHDIHSLVTDGKNVVICTMRGELNIFEMQLIGTHHHLHRVLKVGANEGLDFFTRTFDLNLQNGILVFTTFTFSKVWNLEDNLKHKCAWNLENFKVIEFIKDLDLLVTTNTKGIVSLWRISSQEKLSDLPCSHFLPISCYYNLFLTEDRVFLLGRNKDKLSELDIISFAPSI